MDVDRIQSNNESKNNCYEDWLAFNQSSGMRSSAYEHLIPERLFSTGETRVEAVSTAKALSLAMVEGQRIYTLTADNAGQLSNIEIDDGARAEIQQALGLGLEVTVHQYPITLNGWQGSGYSIIDPDYGVGAYKISGGVAGGLLPTMIEGFEKVIGWIAAFEKALGKLGKFGQKIQALVVKIKKIVSNLKKMLELWENCNPGFALLGSLFTLFMMWGMTKITIGLMGAAGGIGLLCGPLAAICSGLLMITVVYSAISAMNALLEETVDYMVEGCSG